MVLIFIKILLFLLQFCFDFINFVLILLFYYFIILFFSNYANVFSLTDKQYNDNALTLEINNR